VLVSKIKKIKSQVLHHFISKFSSALTSEKF